MRNIETKEVSIADFMYTNMGISGPKVIALLDLTRAFDTANHITA